MPGYSIHSLAISGVEAMSGAAEPRAPEPEKGRRHGPAGFGEYSAARDRFFERLRIDSEIRRLERAWRQPTSGGPQAAGGPTRHD
jgi:hypothetical protein